MSLALDGFGPGRVAVDDVGAGTGVGVRIAVIDSGVHPSHPHVGDVEGGASFDGSGLAGADTVDRLGHGTAVAAAIREKAPDAVIVPVKVFDRELRATADALVAAIRWATADGAHVVNLSLGTANAAHKLRLGEALVDAARAGVCLVAADAQDGIEWLPGSLPLAVGVTLDWTLPREQARVDVTTEGAVRRVRLRASGFPRPIPGVPPERNLKGISFAVANATGLIARHLSRGHGR